MRRIVLLQRRESLLGQLHVCLDRCQLQVFPSMQVRYEVRLFRRQTMLRELQMRGDDLHWLPLCHNLH